MRHWKRIICKVVLPGALLFFLLGAVAVNTVDQLVIDPRTVSSWSELVDCYLLYRNQAKPLVPPGADYEQAVSLMNSGDFSFLADDWSFQFDDSYYYVAEDSALSSLELPLKILMYEDLRNGEIIILSSTDGETYTGEAAFDAPKMLPYESTYPRSTYLFDELAPRRVIWSVTLKPESDAWTDMVSKESVLSASSMALPVSGMSALMSVPAAYTNQIWLNLERQTNGINLEVYAPEGFTNRVEVYSCTDLVSGLWEVAAQNLYPSTNPAIWSTGSETVEFYRAGNMDIDSDTDGINDARELIVHKTDPDLTDSDYDTVSDYQEIYVNATDPNNDDTSPPEITLSHPFGNQVALP